MIDASLDIPRRLNDPPRMFWWDIDVALLVLGAALAGMVAGFFVSGCAVGLLLASAGAAHAADPNLARNLAATCANCHGTNGKAVAGRAVSLLALSLASSVNTNLRTGVSAAAFIEAALGGAWGRFPDPLKAALRVAEKMQGGGHPNASGATLPKSVRSVQEWLSDIA